MNKKYNAYLSAIVLIVLGILFIWLKGGVISIAMTILGVLFIVGGILDILDKKVTPGIIEIVLGIIVIIFGWVLVSVVLIIAAILMILRGGYQLYQVIHYKLQGPNFWIGIISSAINLGIGICLLIYQGATVDWIFIIAGIFLILEGALSLFIVEKK